MTYRYRHGDLRQEEDVLPSRTILLVCGAVVALVSALVGVAWALVDRSEAELRPSGRFPERHIDPGPEVDSIEQTVFELGGQGAALNRTKERMLESYGWVDRERRIVRIPVERAMDIVAEQGP